MLVDESLYRQLAPCPLLMFLWENLAALSQKYTFEDCSRLVSSHDDATAVELATPQSVSRAALHASCVGVKAYLRVYAGLHVGSVEF